MIPQFDNSQSSRSILPVTFDPLPLKCGAPFTHSGALATAARSQIGTATTAQQQIDIDSNR
jgi:hypothetical protein